MNRINSCLFLIARRASKEALRRESIMYTNVYDNFHGPDLNQIISGLFLQKTVFRIIQKSGAWI